MAWPYKRGKCLTFLLPYLFCCDGTPDSVVRAEQRGGLGYHLASDVAAHELLNYVSHGGQVAKYLVVLRAKESRILRVCGDLRFKIGMTESKKYICSLSLASAGSQDHEISCPPRPLSEYLLNHYQHPLSVVLR